MQRNLGENKSGVQLLSGHKTGLKESIMKIIALSFHSEKML